MITPHPLHKDRPRMHVSSASRLIHLQDVSKEYAAGPRKEIALRNITLAIDAGECVAIVGQSGSGKTTLINLLTGIDSPSAGIIEVAGTPIHALNEEALAVWRGKNVGIVFQFFQLLPTLTVAENVMLPMDFCDAYARVERRPRAMELLEQLGIADQSGKFPSDLSGGQQQRAAIARALANDPPILVADEPTGNLDSATSEHVMGLLASLSGLGKTVITVTHERSLSRFFTRTVTLQDGRILSDVAPSQVPA
jgi:putative ABC transport system ATP-binding protein